MWRFPFIDTGCLNAIYYFSDRLGEARTQSVAGWNKITLQNLFLLLMTCSGGACPRQARPHPACPTWLITARSPPPAFPSQPCPHLDYSHPLAAERRPGMDWLSADSRHQGETQSNGTGLARQHEVQ